MCAVKGAIILVAVLALVLVLAGSGDDRQNDQSRDDPKVTAIHAARHVIRKAMKNPNGAQFPLPESGDYTVSDLGGGRWRIGGWVEGTNSFNATVREQWVVELVNTGSDWRATSVTLDGKKLL